MTPEFSHIHRLDSLPPAGKTVKIEANEAERASLAKRFGLTKLESLEAHYRLTRVATGVDAEGEILSKGVQACVITGADVPFNHKEPFHLLFTLDGDQGEEVELQDGDLDQIPIEGGGIDMGEAAAQTLALSLDPFPRSITADTERTKLGIVSEDDVVTGPFAALAGLKKKAED